MKAKYWMPLLLLLSACSPSQPVWHAKAQQWGEFSVHFETRPEVLRQGMNEFLIIVDRKGIGKRHIPDLLVKIRVGNGRWRQAIPDGALGIYRRALSVNDIAQEKLHVSLRYHGKTGELHFDLAPQPTASH